MLQAGVPLTENLIDAANAGKEVQAIYAVAKSEGVRPTLLLKQVALWSLQQVLEQTTSVTSLHQST
jgi:hypothetical protein